MTTTEPKNASSYILTTCKRCGYIVNEDEELCQKCQHQSDNNLKFF